MSRGQNGNKEAARKPKKVPVPNPSRLPAGLAPPSGNPARPKKG